jgi:hypothetical protein
METMKIKIEDVFRPARQMTPAGSMPAKEDNGAGRKTGRFYHWVHRISVLQLALCLHLLFPAPHSLLPFFPGRCIMK